MKKRTAVFLIAALILVLAGCGSSADPNQGVYEARKASMQGISIDVRDVFENGFSVELKSGGKAILHLDGEDYNLQWELDGSKFHLIAADTEFYGTLKDGVMRLPDFQDSGVDVTLICDSLVPDSSAAPRTESSYSEYWDGRWYGWRVNYSGWGDYEGVEDQAFDVLADIVVDGNKGTITLWDQGDSEEDANIISDVVFSEGLTDAGKMTLTDGSAFGAYLPDDGMEVDPGLSTVSSLDHMIELHGIFMDDEENGFEYYVFMRPWGMSWDDVAEAESDDFLYADMMPVSYDDWYLEELK